MVARKIWEIVAIYFGGLQMIIMLLSISFVLASFGALRKLEMSTSLIMLHAWSDLEHIWSMITGTIRKMQNSCSRKTLRWEWMHSADDLHSDKTTSPTDGGVRAIEQCNEGAILSLALITKNSLVDHGDVALLDEGEASPPRCTGNWRKLLVNMAHLVRWKAPC